MVDDSSVVRSLGQWRKPFLFYMLITTDNQDDSAVPIIVEIVLLIIFLRKEILRSLVVHSSILKDRSFHNKCGGDRCLSLRVFLHILPERSFLSPFLFVWALGHISDGYLHHTSKDWGLLHTECLTFIRFIWGCWPSHHCLAGVDA